MKLQPAVVKETKRIAVGTCILLAVMLLVFLALGKLTWPVALGGLWSSAIAVLNFLLLGITVQNSVEGIQGEDEMAQNQARTRMKSSYTMRMLMILALAAVGIAVLRLDTVAVIVPLLFPRVVIFLISLKDQFSHHKEEVRS